jgi:hypothetical protein
MEYSGAFYHITSRGNERKSILRTKKDYERFIGMARVDQKAQMLESAFICPISVLAGIEGSVSPFFTNSLESLMDILEKDRGMATT